MAGLSRRQSISVHLQQGFQVSNANRLCDRAFELPSTLPKSMEPQRGEAVWCQLVGQGDLSGNQYHSLLESQGAQSLGVHSGQLYNRSIRTYCRWPMLNYGQSHATQTPDAL